MSEPKFFRIGGEVFNLRCVDDVERTDDQTIVQLSFPTEEGTTKAKQIIYDGKLAEQVWEYLEDKAESVEEAAAEF